MKGPHSQCLCSLPLFLVLFSITGAYIPHFMNGRPRNGLVGQMYRRNSQTLPPDQWVIQKLNHFDATDQRIWQQRYFVNDTFYKPGGPVFLMIGGEGTADPVWMVQGQWINYAQSYNAFCVQLEHRYYGKSHPTLDLSVKSLAYLSSEQALADLAYFRSYIVNKYSLNENKWIAFGGSYPGSLAAWLRLKYPHLIDGAVSTSAPLKAVIDFKEYLGVVRDALDTTHTGCNEQISRAIAKLESMLQTQSGRDQVDKMFKLCDKLDITNKKDMSNFYSTLAGNFENVVQYNKDNRKFEGAIGTNITVDTLCSIMSSPNSSPVENYARVNDLILKTYGEKCVDFKYNKMIGDLRKTDWKDEAAEGGRQWTYQTCTEFGFFQTSDLDNQPFGKHFDISFSIDQCTDIFGPSFNVSFLSEAVKWTNDYYGSLGIKVTKIVFVNGSIDPWHALGITRDLTSNATAIYINGTAHCANMYPDSPDDPVELKQAREKIKDLIGVWMQ